MPSSEQPSPLLKLKMSYLGVYIVSSTKFKCSLAYAKQACYRSANSLFGKVANAASDMLLQMK